MYKNHHISINFHPELMFKHNRQEQKDSNEKYVKKIGNFWSKEKKSQNIKKLYGSTFRLEYVMLCAFYDNKKECSTWCCYRVYQEIFFLSMLQLLFPCINK